MAKDYDGWCIKTEWDGVRPWTFQAIRTNVVRKWDRGWNLERYPTYAWRNFRKRGTHKIVKVKLLEVKK